MDVPTYSWLIPIYAHLVNNGLKGIETLPPNYVQPVKDYIMANPDC